MIPKFRAWHYELGRMMALKFMWFQDDLIEELELNDTVMNDYITAYPDEIELMLFTNTKDKNDKEIFEGDVLQIDFFKAIVRFGQYRYYDNAGKDVLTGNGFYLEYLRLMDPDCISPYETDVLDKTEIIGNIYENPEYDQNFVGVRIEGKKR